MVTNPPAKVNMVTNPPTLVTMVTSPPTLVNMVTVYRTHTNTIKTISKTYSGEIVIISSEEFRTMMFNTITFDGCAIIFQAL